MCESSFGLAFLDAPTDLTGVGVDIISQDFSSEVIAAVGIRLGV